MTEAGRRAGSSGDPMPPAPSPARVARLDASPPGQGVRATSTQDGRPLGAEDVARCKALVIPPAWDAGVDLPGTQRAHPGRRHRRGRPAPVPVPPGLARAARQGQARPRADRRRAGCPRPARSSPAPRASPACPGSGRSARPSGCSTSGSSGSAASSTPRTTAATAWPRSRSSTSHVTGDEVVFDYSAKSGPGAPGRRRRPTPSVDAVCDAAPAPGRRAASCWPSGTARRWRDISSDDINRYVKDVVGGDVSAKDFRTWHGTVLAAVALAGSADDGDVADAPQEGRAAGDGRRRRSTSATRRRSPAGSYVDPRVVDAYEEGTTIAPTLHRARAVGAGDAGDASRDAIERAVLRLLAAELTDHLIRRRRGEPTWVNTIRPPAPDVVDVPLTSTATAAATRRPSRIVLDPRRARGRRHRARRRRAAGRAEPGLALAGARRRRPPDRRAPRRSSRSSRSTRSARTTSRPCSSASACSWPSTPP